MPATWWQHWNYSVTFEAHRFPRGRANCASWCHCFQMFLSCRTEPNWVGQQHFQMPWHWQRSRDARAKYTCSVLRVSPQFGDDVGSRSELAHRYVQQKWWRSSVQSSSTTGFHQRHRASLPPATSDKNPPINVSTAGSSLRANWLEKHILYKPMSCLWLVFTRGLKQNIFSRLQALRVNSDMLALWFVWLESFHRVQTY